MAKVIKHVDMLDREIKEGGFVACQLSNWRTLELCLVEKLSPKMVRVRSLNHNRYGRFYTQTKYPAEMLVVENQEDITMYILKMSKKDIELVG